MIQRLRKSPAGAARDVSPAPYPLQSALDLDALSVRTLTLVPAGHEPGYYYVGLYRLRRGNGGSGTLQLNCTLSWTEAPGLNLTSLNPFGITGSSGDLLASPQLLIAIYSDGTAPIAFAVGFTGTSSVTVHIDVRAWAAPVERLS